jgi:hypothetical protein
LHSKYLFGGTPQPNFGPFYREAERACLFDQKRDEIYKCGQTPAGPSSGSGTAGKPEDFSFTYFLQRRELWLMQATASP